MNKKNPPLIILDMKHIFCKLSLVLITASVMFSCSKETARTGKDNSGFSKNSESDLVIGFYERNSNITFSFDEDSFNAQYGNIIADSLRERFSFEEIKIVDDAPSDINSEAVLKFVFFDLDSGYTISHFESLSKEWVSTGDTIVYYLEPGASRSITCKGENCEQGGCSYDKKTKDCTKCKNGKCTKEDSASGEITWRDVVGWGITIITILLSMLKPSGS